MSEIPCLSKIKKKGIRCGGVMVMFYLASIFATLKIGGPVGKVVLFIKSGDRDEVYPLGQISSTPEIKRTEKSKMTRSN